MLLPAGHEQYLWANAAFLKTEQLARSFMKSGWDMRPGESAMTGDLPLHNYESDGKTIIQPCAEIPLTEAGAARIIQQGIIPLWSVKNRDQVHSGDFFTLYDD
jgi:predicted component of type VI protein secretion system